MFSFSKIKLLVLLLIITAGAFYYFGNSQQTTTSLIEKAKGLTASLPFLNKNTNETAPEFDTQKITSDLESKVKTGFQNTQSELSTLAEKSKEVSEHAGNVLGSAVTVAPEDQQTSLHEKALEYGQYVYCKQVVEEYESTNPEN